MPPIVRGAVRAPIADMTELQSLEVEEAGVRVRHGGTDVAVLRANPEDVLDSDSFAGGEHFGELRLHRPDIAAPTAVLSGLTGALFLGIRRRISGALHLRSETSTATGSISMDGHALRLKATIVAATGTLTALSRLGLNVPADMRLATRYDGMRAQLAQPQLTAVNLHLDRVAELAVETIFARIEDRDSAFVAPEPELIIRPSSAN